ncbi:MAG: PadR family transcriptional regulator [Candidatus Woesearchaeota archaeon]
MITGQLRCIVLKTLSEQAMSGYSLIKSIQEQTGSWKPSSGSIYPLLEDLLRQDYLTVKRSGRKKVYSITAKGRKFYNLLSTKRNEFVDKIIEGLKVLGSFHGSKDMSFTVEMLEHAKNGKVPLSEVSCEINDLRITLYELYKNNRINQHKEHIKIILRKAVRELRQMK